MHNNIMAYGLRDRPSMLETGRYPQWRSRFLRYIDTRPTGDALRRCFLNGPYIPTTVVVQAVATTDDSSAIPEHTKVETPMNMSLENKAHFESKKDAIHLILTRIRDEIYSTIDAFQTAQEMWEDIERLQQGESLNIQDVKPNLFWEFGKFTSHDGETMESYYTRFYKLMNEMIRNNLTVALIQVNVRFLQQLQPEWSRKPKRVKESAYHKEKMLMCKQAEKGNVDTTPRYKNDNQSGQFGNQRMMNVAGDRENECRKPKRVKESAYHKEKMLMCKQAEKGTDSEPLEQVKNDTRYNVFSNELQHSKQSESISNTCLVETDDSNVIPDSPDMCDDDIQNDQNDVESDDEHVAIANLIVNLKLNVDENKKIQKKLKKANTTLAHELKECKTILEETSKTLWESNSVRDSCLVALQNKQSEFEKYKAFNDCTVDYDKLKRKLNETLRQLAQNDIEIKEGLKLKAYEILVVKDKHDELIKQTLLRKSHYEGLVKQKTKVITDLKLKEEHDIDEMLLLEKQLKFLNEIVYKRSQSIQTIHMMAPKVKECDCLAQKLSKQTESVSKNVHTEILQRFAKVEKHSISLEIALQKCKEQVKNDTVCNEKASNVFRKECEQYIEIQDLKAKQQDKNVAISELKKLIEKGKGKSIDTKFNRPSVVRQPNAQRIPKQSVLGKLAPFLDSLERRYFPKTKSVPKTNVSEGLSKPFTAQTLPQTARQAVSNTNVLKLGMYLIDNRTTHTRAP
nr:hypothetical protein [Tanacetum cinerariifolium]